MWAIEHFWLDGWEAGAANTATLTQPAPSIAGTGGIRLAGVGTVTAPPGTIVGTGTVGAPPVVVTPPLVVRRPPMRLVGTGRIVAPPASVHGLGGIRLAGQGALTAPAATLTGGSVARLVGTGQVTQPAPTLAGTAFVDDHPEDLWLLDLISTEEYLIWLDDRAA